MSDFVLDASLALQWFLDDEQDRQYSLEVLDSFTRQRAFVPILWFYEVGSGLLRAYRRKRTLLPIDVVRGSVDDILQLPALAQKHNLTNYNAAYLSIALRMSLPLATRDAALRQVALNAGVSPFARTPTPRP